MKKFLMTLAAVLCSITIALAQDAQEGRNQIYNITLGIVDYAHHNEKMSAGEAVGKVLAGVLTGQTYLLVDALITNIQAKSSSRTWKDKDDKTHVSTTYTGICEAMLTIKDAKTGEVIANPTMGGRGMSSSSYDTEDRAIREAIERLSSHITTWLNQYRPLEANILEGSTVKKDKQKEVYIDLGSSEGAFVGLHMGVFVVKTVAGREAKSQIGKLKIVAVEGDDISLCKVQSGGKDIKAALDASQQLRVMTIDK